LVRVGLVLALVAVGCGRDRRTDADDDDTGADGDSDADADADGDADPLDVFSLDRVHTVDLEIDEALFPQLEADHETRVRANITYDGVRLEDIGIRVKCGIGSCTTLADKAGFSIKFDQFVEGQELGGFDRLVLNNSIQDTSYSNELLGQELAHRAGIPWKRVAYANVTLNGARYGLFVVVEAVDRKFLRRHFGDEEVEGNLYEGPCCSDFVYDPYYPELKDEVEEGRSREDIIALADFVANTSDDDFIAGIEERIDLTGYLTGYAISALAYHWDGYEYNTNNWYAFHRPSDGRFVFGCTGWTSSSRTATGPSMRGPAGASASECRRTRRCATASAPSSSASWTRSGTATSSCSSSTT
jgi:spore coat protein CotH